MSRQILFFKYLIMKKIISMIILFLIFVNPFTISFADSKIKIEKAKSIANEYIKNSFQDENWKDKNPRIIWNWVYNYVDSENPSYIEFKIECNENPNCWFIIVNIDGNDVWVPIASTIWAAPSEVLIEKWQEENTKMYYFWPFEQYSENTVSWDVNSINPNDYDNSINKDKKLSNQEINLKINSQKENIKNKFKNSKDEAIKFKKSSEFESRKNEIKKIKESIPAWEFSMKLLPMSYADTEIPNTSWYIAPSASNIFLPGWMSSTICSWATPCYKQYDIGNCKSWCWPTAISIVYGYYDRNWKWDLLPWTAWLVNDFNITTMNNSIRTMVSTNCWWSTNVNNMPLAIQYAKDKWYTNSTSNYYLNKSISNIFSKVKTEINAWRPIIIANDNHAMVAFWYNSNVNNIVRVNLWWGGSSVINWNWVTYQTSNIDYNINSMYYNWSSQSSIKHYVTYYID